MLRPEQDERLLVWHAALFLEEQVRASTGRSDADAEEKAFSK